MAEPEEKKNDQQIEEAEYVQEETKNEAREMVMDDGNVEEL